MKNFFKRFNILFLVLIIVFSNIGTVFAEEETHTDNVEVETEAPIAYPVAPEVTAGAAILMDADTGAILYEKDAYSNYYPASITKIMTCILAIENLSLSQKITFTKEVFEELPWDAALLGVEVGEELTVEDCLYGLMLRSGNEVAVALAREISGTEDAFGELMTARAKEMGALSTVFTNSSGLYEDTHYTTAYDMAVIVKEGIKNGTFAKVWGTERYTMSATNLYEEYDITNRHFMINSSMAEYNKYVEGGKTGYEDLAKRTLVTHAKKDGLSLICVVLYDETETVYVDTEMLLDYGFTNFRKTRVVDEENRFGSGRFVSILDSDYITLPNDLTVSKLQYEIIYNEDNSGGNIAQIKYSYDGHYLGSGKLQYVEEEEIDNGVVTPVKKDEPKEENLYIDVWYIVAAIVVVLFIVLISVYLVKTKKERKIKRDRKRLFKEEGRKYKIKKRRRN